MAAVQTDRIEKQILLHASRARVWQALTSSEEFGEWFGARLDSAFTPGAIVKGVMTGTTVDPEVAKAQQPYKGTPFEITIDRIEPQRLFSFRWHPNAVERGVDYSHEPTTLIEFTLEERPDGILLTITESGFDRIPLARRAAAFASNEQGWGMVVTLVEKYLARHA